MLYNPSLAGVDGYTVFNLTAREQWVGFKQSPKTHTFSAQTRLLKSGYKLFQFGKRKRYFSKTKGRVGLGAYVFDDRSGLLSRTGMQFSYAYHLYVRGTQISMGLGISGFQFNLNKKHMLAQSSDDPLIYGNDVHMFVPDANVGFFMMNQHFYAGISASQLMESAIKIGRYALNDYHLNRHYYINLGTYLYLSKEFTLEPSLLLKTTENWNLQTDISLSGKYQEKYFAGLSYRTSMYSPYKSNDWEEVNHQKSGDIIAMLGIHINTFFIGYAFDFPLTGMRKYSYGSHELAVSLRLGSTERKYRWKDRF